MKVIQTKAGAWRVEIDPTTAIEFDELWRAEELMDAVDNGLVPREALKRVLRRRARKEKHEQER